MLKFLSRKTLYKSTVYRYKCKPFLGVQVGGTPPCVTSICYDSYMCLKFGSVYLIKDLKHLKMIESLWIMVISAQYHGSMNYESIKRDVYSAGISITANGNSEDEILYQLQS